jgi:hypothetical protein
MFLAPVAARKSTTERVVSEGARRTVREIDFSAEPFHCKINPHSRFLEMAWKWDEKMSEPC